MRSLWNDIIQKGERNATHSKPKNSQRKGSSYTIYRLPGGTAGWNLFTYYCPSLQNEEPL
jgi:hypothetical protein